MIKVIECSFAGHVAPTELIEEANRLGLSGFKIVKHSSNVSKDGFVNAKFTVVNDFDVLFKVTTPDAPTPQVPGSDSGLKTK